MTPSRVQIYGKFSARFQALNGVLNGTFRQPGAALKACNRRVTKALIVGMIGKGQHDNFVSRVQALVIPNEGHNANAHDSPCTAAPCELYGIKGRGSVI